MLKGTGVALVTPFTGRQIDFDGLTRTIEHCIAGGVDYLVSLGTTGETVTLSPEERQEVLQHTARVVAGRVPLVAGFGGNNTDQIIYTIEQQDFSGISAVLSVSPYYNRPTQEGIFRHYLAIAEACPLPILLYNVPSRTGSNVSADTVIKLAHSNPKFIGVKEASGNLLQAAQIYRQRPDGFLLISGDDINTLPLMALGADGLISVLGNAVPSLTSQMVRACLRDDFAAARRLHHRLTQLIDLLFVEGNPAGVKGALEVLGICQRDVRLPLTPLGAGTLQLMRQQLELLGLYPASPQARPVSAT